MKRTEKKKTFDASSMTTLRKVLRFIGRYRVLLAASFVLAAVTVVLQLYIPILFGDAIDGIVGAGKVRFGWISASLVKIGILLAAASLASWGMNLINNRAGHAGTCDPADSGAAACVP